jgi:ADP-heptose:LPS heptosyltransferase
MMAFAHPTRPAIDGPPWRPDEHEATRWCRLLAAYGIPSDKGDLDLPWPAAPGLAQGPVPGAVVLHPGAKHVARRWPPGWFAAVAREIRADGHRVLLTGTAAETGIAELIATEAGIPQVDVLAGRTGLGALAALVAGARLVICGDTGVGHLATACRTRSVLLFGPTPPQLWGPPPDRPEHEVLWAGRRGDPFAAEVDPGLLDISVPDVLAAARRALAAAPDHRGQAGHPAGRLGQSKCHSARTNYEVM